MPHSSLLLTSLPFYSPKSRCTNNNPAVHALKLNTHNTSVLQHLITKWPRALPFVPSVGGPLMTTATDTFLIRSGHNTITGANGTIPEYWYVRTWKFVTSPSSPSSSSSLGRSQEEKID
ncbi:hypothetical protein L873DRAFT_603159 [Choiromyces venosus 120613-1]|uniref:Uncharacterized protein n=1 Tax=Choiromyces venosus 120613-1 TaxID=1336337 RepID=A0A3N4JX58_9PEZI|nr:hypothetical protein L873DRAFT_603159 [Choiromyces venosus 120613-1]